uniref:Uncharacterized protein n=1 Tax=Ralstonia solanacearum TaxID=305 RepID=A0A0S4XL80_RALSL|nr:protein of unknown function [Ralstonia solanacearum]
MLVDHRPEELRLE